MAHSRAFHSIGVVKVSQLNGAMQALGSSHIMHNMKTHCLGTHSGAQSLSQSLMLYLGRIPGAQQPHAKAHHCRVSMSRPSLPDFYTMISRAQISIIAIHVAHVAELVGHRLRVRRQHIAIAEVFFVHSPDVTHHNR